MVLKRLSMESLYDDPFMRPLLDDICVWVSNITGVFLTSDNFPEPLETGVTLCCLAEVISDHARHKMMKCPVLHYKRVEEKRSFQAMCNIEVFLKWAKALGVRDTCLFETGNLIQHNFLRNVLICLLEIARIAEIFGVKQPRLLELEQETQMAWKDLISISVQRTPSKQVLSVDEISASIDDLKLKNRHKENFIATVSITNAVMKWKKSAQKSLDERLDAIQAVEISASGVISPQNLILEERTYSKHPNSGNEDNLNVDKKTVQIPVDIISVPKMEQIEVVLEAQEKDAKEFEVEINVDGNNEPKNAQSIAGSFEVNHEVGSFPLTNGDDSWHVIDKACLAPEVEPKEIEVEIVLEDSLNKQIEDGYEMTVESLPDEDDDGMSLTAEKGHFIAVKSEPDQGFLFSLGDFSEEDDEDFLPECVDSVTSPLNPKLFPKNNAALTEEDVPYENSTSVKRENIHVTECAPFEDTNPIILVTSQEITVVQSSPNHSSPSHHPYTGDTPNDLVVYSVDVSNATKLHETPPTKADGTASSTQLLNKTNSKKAESSKSKKPKKEKRSHHKAGKSTSPDGTIRSDVKSDFGNVFKNSYVTDNTNDGKPDQTGTRDRDAHQNKNAVKHENKANNEETCKTNPKDNGSSKNIEKNLEPANKSKVSTTQTSDKNKFKDNDEAPKKHKKAHKNKSKKEKTNHEQKLVICEVGDDNEEELKVDKDNVKNLQAEPVKSTKTDSGSDIKKVKTYSQLRHNIVKCTHEQRNSDDRFPSAKERLTKRKPDISSRTDKELYSSSLNFSWKGCPILRDCRDIVITQCLIEDVKPLVIIELGTFTGGNAIWMADMLLIHNIPGHVYTIDKNSSSVCDIVKDYTNVTFMNGDVNNIDEILKPEFLSSLPHPWIVVEDCNVNVKGILIYMSQYMIEGDYFIIEKSSKKKLGTTTDIIGEMDFLETRKIKDVEKFLKRNDKAFRVDSFYTDLYEFNGSRNWNGYIRKME